MLLYTSYHHLRSPLYHMSEALLSLGAASEIHLMWVNERVRSYRKKQKVGLVRPTSSLHHLKSQRELQSIRGSETEPKFM